MNVTNKNLATRIGQGPVAECLRSVAVVPHIIPVVVEFFVFARNVPEERRVMSLL